MLQLALTNEVRPVNAPTNVPVVLSYLFSSEVSCEMFGQFIADICDVADGWYTYDESAFRRMVYKNRYESFAREVAPHCKAYLRHMIIRVPVFSSLMVIISHICVQHSLCVKTDRESIRGRKWLRIKLN